jgi:hypothetical protein
MTPTGYLSNSGKPPPFPLTQAASACHRFTTCGGGPSLGPCLVIAGRLLAIQLA